MTHFPGTDVILLRLSAICTQTDPDLHFVPAAVKSVIFYGSRRRVGDAQVRARSPQGSCILDSAAVMADILAPPAGPAHLFSLQMGEKGSPAFT